MLRVLHIGASIGVPRVVPLVLVERSWLESLTSNIVQLFLWLLVPFNTKVLVPLISTILLTRVYRHLFFWSRFNILSIFAFSSWMA